MYKNCTPAPGEDPSASAAFDVVVTRGGKPLTGTTLDGLGMTGSCAENGVKPFYFNPDKEPVDDMENKLWFTNYTTKADGKVAGHGANDGLIRTVAQGKKDAVKSVMLVETKTNSILSCCDLVTAGPPTTNWTKALDGKGKVCEPEGHSMHGAPAAAKLASDTNSTKSNATMHDAHDGHDHSGHDHSSDNSTSKAASAPKTSAAGAATGSVAVAAASGVAVLMLLVL